MKHGISMDWTDHAVVVQQHFRQVYQQLQL